MNEALKLNKNYETYVNYFKGIGMIIADNKIYDDDTINGIFCNLLELLMDPSLPQEHRQVMINTVGDFTIHYPHLFVSKVDNVLRIYSLALDACTSFMG